jgi:hypothetical protein
MILWARFGFLIGLASLFCIGIKVALQATAIYASWRWGLCGLLLGGGGLLWVSWLLGRRHSAIDEEAQAPAERERLLGSKGYWGLAFTLFGVIVALLPPLGAREAPAPEPPPAAQLPAAPAVAREFPSVRLQGLIYRTNNPEVLIDGTVYRFGDAVGDARIVAIDAQSVTLELDGQQKRIELPH